MGSNSLVAEMLAFGVDRKDPQKGKAVEILRMVFKPEAWK